jgi:hypothetical protein
MAVAGLSGGGCVFDVNEDLLDYAWVSDVGNERRSPPQQPW